MDPASAALAWLKRRWLPVAVAALVVLLLFGNSGFRRVVRQRLLLRSLRQEMTRLKQEETDLKKQVVLADTDERALEKAARKELDYRKPGEYEYRFPPPKKKAPPTLVQRIKNGLRRMLEPGSKEP